MAQSDLLIRVARVLDSAGIGYMLTGSFVSTLQGDARSTHDVDFVVNLKPPDVPALLKNFPPPDFYLDEIAIEAAIENKSMVNLLEVGTGDKVDFWMLTDSAFDQSRFARKYVIHYFGQPVFVPRPEDTILQKLEWSRISGGSEKQLFDVHGVIEHNRDSLDVQYLEHWAAVLNVSDQLKLSMK